ncbi:MAG: DNA recombination protein RmuC, partial [Clostridiales bacterium]|nr:DNA recombination protein RmuC [Clostridiales bacterium]
VYKGLGEMQMLAGGVGDLKKVLANVKTRGIWGEMQLGNILQQMLAPSQYAENIELVPGSGKRVEYAVIMPGSKDEKVYLPIDSKFPIEDYERLLATYETGDVNEIKRCQGSLENAFKEEGKRIAGKYIVPPATTDFAVMFVPVEGLYAEALQRRGLIEFLQEKLRIVVAGPTTLTALLTSLQVGFRTLAIEKRSGEVWQLLGAVKGEFGKFTELLESTQRRINSVSTSIEDAAKKSRTIQRRLRDVEALGEDQASRLLTGGQISSPDDENE